MFLHTSKMWYQILTLTSLAIQSNCQHHSAIVTNNSDVIVTYEGHAEANVQPKFERKPDINIITTPGLETEKSTNDEILIPDEPYITEAPVFSEDETEGVVFVPNEKTVYRNYEYRDDRVNVGELMGKKSISDVMNNKNIRVASESPNEEILFISGKNNENVEKSSKKEIANDVKTSAKEKKKVSLHCSSLDCNNTLKSVCGGKMEHRQWRYRLFLNECYFRKVNCGFKYEENRFREMPIELCKQIGSHMSERPFVYSQPQPILPREKPAPVVLRRSSSSRRSFNLDIDGSFCSHPCPTTCPEEYSPECAVTSNGQRKVFINHCKLDLNSCSYGTVWHRRPLSDCVGNRKADLRQNRAFIGWMQRIGIVDNQGKLVTS